MHSEHTPIQLALLDDDRFYHKLIATLLTRFQDPSSPRYVKDIQLVSFLHAEDMELNLNHRFQVVILDYFIDKGITSMRLVKKIREVHPETKILVISQHLNVRTSLLTHLNGADEFIRKDGHFSLELEKFLDFALAGYMEKRQ